MLHPSSMFAGRDPFALMRRMGGEFDRALPGPAAAQGYPAVNIWQGSEAVAVTAELPGVAPDEIDISVKDTLLTIAGRRPAPEAGSEAVWHRRERAFGTFSRSVRLPFRVDPDKVEARVEHGVLRIVAYRRSEDMPRRIDVKPA